MKKALNIFSQFLQLGCYSFGGPAAHIGYFRKQFVEELKWLDEDQYAQFVAMSHFLPGPGSSQVGFAIGLHRSGLAGGIAAFIGFTLPSFLILLAFALSLMQLAQLSQFAGVVHGLKLLSVVVVADACLLMARNFCNGWLSRIIAATAALTLIIMPWLSMQMTVLLLSALLGSKYLSMQDKPALSSNHALPSPFITARHYLLLLLFFGLLLISFWPSGFSQTGLLDIFFNFYQAGSLVFGGGHVVLPLLQNSVGQQLVSDIFLSGYAAAQAIPGPMFSLAAYLGALLSESRPILSSVIATIAIFLPGFILVYVLREHLQCTANRPRVQGAIKGVNASVVGLLAATCYSPVFLSSVLSWLDVVLVVFGFVLLCCKKARIHWIVILYLFLGLFFYR